VTEIYPAATIAAIEANKPKMVPVLLSRHYRPRGEHEIAGHWTQQVEKKNVLTGKMEVVKPSEFIANEPAPPPMAGVGTSSPKLWAGTLVRLPAEEAKTVRREGIGTVEIE
jgi:hypothetical protein